MLLIFDCDGVILDSMVLHTEVEASSYRDIGIHITAEELVARFAGVAQSEVSRVLSLESGVEVPPNLDRRIEEKKVQVFSERLRSMPGIFEALEEVNALPRCIASGTGVASLKHMLSVTGLYAHFSPHIYSSEMVPRGKPFPDLFLYAADRMNHDPDTCIVIEDGVAGVQAGKAANMTVLGFTGGSHTTQNHKKELLDAGADIVFSSMQELPRLIKERLKNE